MTYKALLFGTDDLYPQLKPFYEQAIKNGTIEIIAAATFENGQVNFVADKVNGGGLSIS